MPASLHLVSQDRGDKAHEHRWMTQVHLDGCHWHRTGYRCIDCGAGFLIQHERDLKDDPWSGMWMTESVQGEWVTRDERGRYVTPYWKEGEACARCGDLLNGGTPAEPYSEYTPSPRFGI